MSFAALGDLQPPITAAVGLRTPDVDEARAVGANMYHAHELDVLGDRNRFLPRFGSGLRGRNYSQH
jgi:hypothetical protein